jgi:anaerobic dimethyl sulfoxide reductase subunit B (iron-sulfur subunit)
MDQGKGIVGKCDFCRDLLAKGENPACVDACLMRCLEYGEIEELRSKYGDNAQIDPLAGPEMTGPNYVVVPHRLKSSIGAGAIINPVEELI